MRDNTGQPKPITNFHAASDVKTNPILENENYFTTEIGSDKLLKTVAT